MYQVPEILPRILEFNLMSQDIADGRPGNYVYCPIGHALRRRFYVTDVFVALGHVTFVHHYHCYAYDTSDSVSEFIKAFDKKEVTNESVQPIRARLERKYMRPLTSAERSYHLMKGGIS